MFTGPHLSSARDHARRNFPSQRASVDHLSIRRPIGPQGPPSALTTLRRGVRKPGIAYATPVTRAQRLRLTAGHGGESKRDLQHRPTWYPFLADHNRRLARVLRQHTSPPTPPRDVAVCEITPSRDMIRSRAACAAAAAAPAPPTTSTETPRATRSNRGVTAREYVEQLVIGRDLSVWCHGLYG